MSLEGGWIDASAPVSDGMVHWPEDPAVEISLALSIERGEPANVTKLAMSAHTGTHLDAPRHFIADGPGIDTIPHDAVVGAARVIEITNPEVVTAGELESHELASGERILLRTRNSQRRWWREEFQPDFVHIEPAAAELIAAAGVRTLGIDYLSVGGADTGAHTHRALLGAGVWIIEGLDLTDVAAGDYDLICLPLRLVGADGAPARALLRARSEGSTDE